LVAVEAPALNLPPGRTVSYAYAADGRRRRMIAYHQDEQDSRRRCGEAFDAIRRPLEGHVRRLRGAVKSRHPATKQ